MDLALGFCVGGRKWQFHGDNFVVGHTHSIDNQVANWDGVGDDKI